MDFRPYQQTDFNLMVKAINDGNRHVLFSAPTGYGKSSIIYNIVKYAVDRGRRTLILAPRRKLIKQLSETLAELGDLSVLMGGDSIYDRNSLIQIASIGTVHSRIKKHGIEYLEEIHNIVWDEVHIGMNKSAFNYLKEMFWERSIWVGLSATPIDSRGYMLEGFDITINNTQTQDLINIGFLCDVDCYRPMKLDLSGIKIQAGEYNEKELNAEMSGSVLIRNAFDVYKDNAEGLKTMIFCVSISHAELIKEEFERNGISVGIAHSKMNEDEEEKHLKSFRDRDIMVLISVGKLTTGFDDPTVECLLFLRPTKSLPLFLQMVGRGLRIHESKSVCKILDCANNIEEHGYPTMKRDFGIKKPARAKGKAEEPEPCECPYCDEIIPTREMLRRSEESSEEITVTYICPYCNEEIKALSTAKVEISTSMEKIKKEKMMLSSVKNWEDLEKELRKATNKDGKKYHWKWAGIVTQTLQEEGFYLADTINFINYYNRKGWSIGGMIEAMRKRKAEGKIHLMAEV